MLSGVRACNPNLCSMLKFNRCMPSSHALACSLSRVSKPVSIDPTARCVVSRSFARLTSEIPDEEGDLENELVVPVEDDDDDEDTFYPDIVECTPILSAEQVADIMYDSVHSDAAVYFKSFYSSVYGGIVTDPALFLLPIDDHMVHRGHAVFDTALMVEGNIYQLDAHLERFFTSAYAARFLRYWMSAGRGGFTLSGNDTIRSEFYCVCYNGPHSERDQTVGLAIKTSKFPNKHPHFAELKSVNYLQNAMNIMDAQDTGHELGVFLHEDGTISEGPTLNIGIITKEGVVKVPPFEGCLAGCTMQRIIELIPGFAEQDLLEGIVGVVQGPITLEEAYAAQEVFVAGGSLPVAAVTQWDGRPIADGRVGVGALVLTQMIINDMTPKEGNDQLTPIPYGILTGMIEDAL